jgi:hypothetical protein
MRHMLYFRIRRETYVYTWCPMTTLAGNCVLCALLP